MSAPSEGFGFYSHFKPRFPAPFSKESLQSVGAFAIRGRVNLGKPKCSGLDLCLWFIPCHFDGGFQPSNRTTSLSEDGDDVGTCRVRIHDHAAIAPSKNKHETDKNEQMNNNNNHS